MDEGALLAATPPTTAGRHDAALAGLCFAGFRAARVDAVSMPAVAAMRSAGFGRTLRPGIAAPERWIDEWDTAPGGHVVAVWDGDGEMVASMRLNDSRAGPLELAAHVDLAALVPAAHWPLLQCARLCATRSGRRVEALFALQKAIWRRALRDGVQSLILATPYWSRWMYEALQFEDLGDASAFIHPLTGTGHRVMIFDVPSAEERLEAAGNPLARQLFRVFHADLEY